MPSSPRSPRWTALLALSLLCAPSVAAAEADAAARQPFGPLLSARGIEAYRAGELARAVELLQRAVARTPADASARHHLGLALIRRGEARAGRRQLSAAARLAPDDPRLLADLGLAYLAEGNAAWAVRSLRRAVALAPGDGRLRYLLGTALLRLEQADEALEALAAARRRPGVDPEALALQIGMAHYGAGRWAAAREAVSSLLLGRRGGVARRLTRATHEAEGRGAAWLSATLASGGVVDSNPLFEHETSAPTAVGLSLDGRLVVRPWVGTRRVVSAELSAGRVFYAPVAATPAGATDVTHASRTDLGAGARVASAIGRGGRARLAASYRFGLTLLDAPPGLSSNPTLVDHNQIFTELHAGALALSLEHRPARRDRDVLEAAPPASTTLRYSLARQVFADLARSHLANELLVEHVRAHLGGRLRLLAWLGLRHELAESPDYHAAGPVVGLGGSYLGPWRVVLGARLAYGYQDHYRSGSSGRWGQLRRRDHTLAGTLEVSRALAWGLRLTLVYQRSQNLSSVESFDYGRDLLTLALSWSHR